MQRLIQKAQKTIGLFESYLPFWKIFLNVFLVWYIQSVISDVFQDRNSFLLAGLIWLVGIILIKLIFEKTPARSLYLWIFYSIIVARLRFTKDSKLIEDSFVEQTLDSGKKVSRPLLVRKTHLQKTSFLRNWAFEIVLIKKNPIIQQRDGNFTLHVDLRGSTHGIYNNPGKRYISKPILENVKEVRRFHKESEDVNTFLYKGASPEEKRHEVPISNLRWASGGALPIVKWRGMHWIVTFFRDINPIGLNVANGASENSKEYKKPDYLMFREFAEEVILFDSKPCTNGNTVNQKTFYSADFDKIKFESKRFTKQHKRYRERQDNIVISNNNHKKDINTFNVPFNAKIKTGDIFRPTQYVNNILFSINPHELGIEIIKLIFFKMEPNDYIVDGEILENFKTLARRPVVLISLDYLRKVFNTNKKSLGELIQDPPYSGCKRLSGIPPFAYHVYSGDIEFRKKRFEFLSRQRSDSPELKFQEQWLQNYGKMFEAVTSDDKPALTPTEYKDLLTLCPVTWKSLELAFRYCPEINALKDSSKNICD